MNVRPGTAALAALAKTGDAEAFGRPYGLQQETGAVFIAAAIGAFTGVGGQQFAQQIPVAGFDIHSIESRLCGETGRDGVPFGQDPQLIIG